MSDSFQPSPGDEWWEVITVHGELLGTVSAHTWFAARDLGWAMAREMGINPDTVEVLRTHMPCKKT